MSVIDVLEDDLANLLAELSDQIILCSTEQERTKIKVHFDFLDKKLRELRTCLQQQRVIDRKLDETRPMDDELLQLALFDSQDANTRRYDQLKISIENYIQYHLKTVEA